MRLLREVTGVDKSPVQQIVATVKEAYLLDIRNRTTNLINDTMSGVLTHLQENYGQLMPHKILEQEDIVKKTNYNPRDPIAIVLSAVEELLKFSDITGMSYTKLQAVNTAYVIVHKTGKFVLAISEWNCMPEIQKTWVGFKTFFQTDHQDLR